MAVEFSRKNGEICYHEAMESARTCSQLQREVLPPQKAEQGLGVLVLFSTAMFCAVLSSAFVLQARSARYCPGTAPAGARSFTVVDDGAGLADSSLYSTDDLATRAKTRALVEVVEVVEDLDVGDATRVTDQGDCVNPAYRKNGDGSVTVEFQLCPDGVDSVWVLKSAEYRE